MPTRQDWERQTTELQELGIDVHEGDNELGPVLYTLIDALIASVRHIQRHDGAIEALAEDLRALAPPTPAEKPLTLEDVLPARPLTAESLNDGPSPP